MEFVAGNIYIRPFPLEKAGMTCPGHAHNFDHVTYVVKGKVHVRAVIFDADRIKELLGSVYQNIHNFVETYTNTLSVGGLQLERKFMRLVQEPISVPAGIEVSRDDGTISFVQEQDFAAGEFLLIKANALHTITSLVDDSLFHCVYSHRTPQGEVSEVYTGWNPAYV